MAAISTSRRTIKRLFRLLSTERRTIYLILFYAMINGIIVLTLPLGIQAIINYIMGGRVSSSWVILIIVVAAGLIISGLIQIAQMSMTERLQQRIFTKSSFELAVRIPKIKFQSIRNRYAPEMVNQFFDTVTLQKSITKLLVDYPSSILQVTFGLVLISIYHPLFMVFSVGVILLLYLLFKFTGPQGVSSSLNESTQKYEVAHWLEELARTMGTFKLAGTSKLPLLRVDRLIINYLEFRNKHFGILILQYKSMVAFKVIVVIALLILGSLLLIDNQISIGQFVAAEIIIILIMNSIEKLIIGLETVYDTLTSVEKLGALTDMELENPSSTPPVFPNEQFGFDLNLENIRFRYPESNKLVIHQLSLHAKAGSKIVLAGSAGSGKSTLMQLILGLYDNYEGQITYNGLSMATLRLDLLRKEIGDNIWHESLFKGTLRENLTLGNPDHSDSQAMRAAAIVGLDEEIKKLPDGLDTQIFPGGVKLPRTTGSKIILTRAIIGQFRLLLLDLDGNFLRRREKERLFAHLFEQPWTAIISTHNEEIMSKADDILFMENGEIVFHGDYSEFKNTPYAESIR